jgi:hypothetical protein
MAANAQALDSGVPADLERAVADDAARFAHYTGHFLKRLCESGGSGWPPRIPFSLPFLADVGAALRLKVWEASGVQVHREAGLPAADVALCHVMQSLLANESLPWPPPADALCRRVLGLWMDHFAWSGPVELHADIVIDVANEHALLEALADFCWVHRPR